MTVASRDTVLSPPSLEGAKSGPGVSCRFPIFFFHTLPGQKTSKTWCLGVFVSPPDCFPVPPLLLMMSMRSYVMDVIGGRRRGFLPALVKGFLSLVSLVYGFLHVTRKALYRIGILRRTRLSVPVISVGNLTMGGTGKTPVVEMLAHRIAGEGLSTAVLARGYGKIDAAQDDENLLFDVEHVVRLTGANRVRSAERALREYDARVLILDDGFQHFRIERDLDILVVDSLDPFGGGRLLPRGGLRERPANAARADLIVLTRTDQVSPVTLRELNARLANLSRGKPVVETVHRPVHLRALGNKQRHELNWLRGKRVSAFCGLGNPEGFRRTLESLGAEILLYRAFPDHHLYTEQDIRRLNLESREFMADLLVTTEKDALKLRQESFEIPLLALRVEIEVTKGADLLAGALDRAVRPRRSAAAGVVPRK